LVSSSIKNIVRDIIIVAVGVAVIWIGLQVYFGAANPFYVVSSGSMYPQLAMYDIIVITGNQPFEDVKVGDIIVFDRPKDHNKVIVHRVVAVVDDDPKTLRTKGDNNQSSIPGTDFPITEKEYTGTVIHVIPQVGYITKILQPPINYIIIAVIVGIMVVKQILKNKNKKELAFSDSDEASSNEKIDEISNDDEYIQSKDFVGEEKTYAEKLDKENTKSEENIPEFFQDKEKESEKSKE
jgi:signal peptidase